MRLLALCASLLAACVLPPQPPKPIPGADCDAACATLVRLSCVGAEGSAGPDRFYGTPDDAPCHVACADLEAAGVVPLNTGCVAAARTCAEVEACAEE